MDTQTQTQDIGQQLQNAVLQAAVDAAESADANDSQSTEKRPQNGEKRPAVGNGGVRTPSGRPKGVRNKLTNLRDAVIEAFGRVGGADYLVRLAEGTQSDRAAFVSLMNKVLPTQVQANVDGGIKLELSWLSARSIGTNPAQSLEHKTQVIDLQQDSAGSYRIKDQSSVAEPGPAQENSDPHPPQKPVGGGSQG